MWRCSGLMPRAALCLEGHWVKMRPGAAVMAHPRRRMAVGCHRPRAQRGTSCCAVTGASSAALRGGKMLRLLAFFPRTLRSSLHRGKTKKPDRAQTSARPTAVLPGQECARGRHTRAPSGRHPPVRTAAETDASPPGQTSSSSSTADCPDTGTAASSEYRGRQVISLRPTRGSVWMQASLRASKTRPVHCFASHLIRWHRPDATGSTRNAARARGGLRSPHDGRLT